MVCNHNNSFLNAEHEPQDLDHKELEETIDKVKRMAEKFHKETSASINQTAENVHQELQTSVTAISNRIDSTVNMLNSSINTAESRMNVRVDNIIAHNNDTEGNSELTDIRNGINGITYLTAGDAVRDQAEKISTKFVPYYGDGNIFNKESATFNNHYYRDDGEYREMNGYGYSEYIPVEPNTKYYFSHPFFINYFNSSKEYISGSHNSYLGANMTTPSGCAFIIISIDYAYKNVFMVCKGTLPNEYVPFRYMIDKNHIVDEITPLQNAAESLNIRLTSAEKTIEQSQGLNIYCIGDSLTKGVDHGTHVIEKGYPYWLEQLLDSQVVNCGYPGATSQSWWNTYKSLYAEPTSDTDVVLIMFGSNGGLDSNTLITDVEPYSDYNDYADSGVGNMCKIIEWVMEKTSNHAQIILITPPVNWTQGAEYRYTRVLNSVPVIKKIAQRYSLPVIDVFNESGMNRLNGSTFRPNDGLHFNEKGYQKLGTFIANKLKSYYSTFDIE